MHMHGTCTAHARHMHGTCTARVYCTCTTWALRCIALCLTLCLSLHTVHRTAQSEFEWSQGRLEIYMLAVGLPTCIFGAALILGVVRPPPLFPTRARTRECSCV